MAKLRWEPMQYRKNGLDEVADTPRDLGGIRGRFVIIVRRRLATLRLNGQEVRTTPMIEPNAIADLKAHAEAML